MATRYDPNQVFTVTNASQQLLGENHARRYLYIQNKGSAAVYINFGAAATAANGILLAASGGSWSTNIAPVDSVHAIAASGSNAVVVVQA